MKFIKLYESFEDIEDIDSICKEYRIRDYTINSDGTVDVDGDVYLSSKGLTKLPLKFGKVGDYFDCSNNQLTTLEGCPQSVGGSFNSASNKLTTLEGGPQSVGSHFNCTYNRLISLEGCPQSIGGYFSFQDNRLKDLYGFSEFFEGLVNYTNNPVTEILDLFKYVTGTNRIGKVIDLLNEYDVIQHGKLVILDRLEEIFYILNMKIPEEINLKNYEVY